MRLAFVVAAAMTFSVGCAQENETATTSPEPMAEQAAPASNSMGLRVDGDTTLKIDESRLSPELKKIHDHIDENFEEHVQNLQRWIQQPSISNTGEGIPESAQMVKGFWDELGCTATVYEPGTTEWGSQSNPVVYAKCDEGAPRTLMIYWMYDTMPVTQPDLWKAPPFEARIMEQAPYNKVIIGRGASNSKGGQMLQLNALRSIKAVAGKLPVNLIVVAEGDEERMSIGLRTWARANPDLLKGAEAMWRGGGGGGGVSFGSSEGCVYIELTTSGAKWGRGPVYSDIHGGRKRAVDSPAWRHMRMLSKLINEDTNTAEVAGFYDNQEPMTAEQIAALKERAQNVNLEAAAKALGVARFIADDPYEYLRMANFGMSFNLDGIWGGNMYGGGAGAILPNKITSKHNVRYMPVQDGIDIVNKIRKQIDQNGYPDVEMKIIGDVPWHKGEQYRNDDLINAMLRAYPIFGVQARPPRTGEDTAAAADLGDRGWVIEPLTTSGGYWPAYLFGGDHQIPIHGAGVGAGGGNNHAANEFYVVEGAGDEYGINGAEKFLATILYEFAGLNGQ